MDEGASLEERNAYLVKDSVSDSSYGLFLTKLAAGYEGLCLTRSNPAEIQRKYNLKAPIIWLTNQKSDDFFSSANIETLKTKVKSFVKKNPKSIVLLDRVDYLINLHGFNEVIKFLYSLNDEILVTNAILMLNINPETLTPHQLSLLEQELKEVPRQRPKVVSELADDLHEILTFVNNNEKVTFKKVSREFSITKTTTRKRINKLEEKGLIIVKKNGRNKIVRATELGKKLL